MPLSSSNHKLLVRHMVRWIATVSDPEAGHKTVTEVDMEVGSLVLQGYKLFDTHYLSVKTNPATGREAYGVMYIFVLETGEVEKIRKGMYEKEVEKA
jgi:hypothetical protein